MGARENRFLTWEPYKRQGVRRAIDSAFAGKIVRQRGKAIRRYTFDFIARRVEFKLCDLFTQSACLDILVALQRALWQSTLSGLVPEALAWLSVIIHPLGYFFGTALSHFSVQQMKRVEGAHCFTVHLTP